MSPELVGRRPWAAGKRKGASGQPARSVHTEALGTALVVIVFDNAGMWMAWGRIARRRSPGLDRPQIREHARGKITTAHRPGITSPDVDRMWMAMYESNPHSNNYNKKILELDSGRSPQAS